AARPRGAGVHPPLREQGIVSQRIRSRRHRARAPAREAQERAPLPGVAPLLRVPRARGVGHLHAPAPLMTDLDVHFPAIAAGDAGAFGRWLAGAEPCLRQSLRPFAARVDTEAVVQEALLRTWQVVPRHAPDGRPNSLLRLALRI